MTVLLALGALIGLVHVAILLSSLQKDRWRRFILAMLLWLSGPMVAWWLSPSFDQEGPERWLFLLPHLLLLTSFLAYLRRPQAGA